MTPIPVITARRLGAVIRLPPRCRTACSSKISLYFRAGQTAHPPQLSPRGQFTEKYDCQRTTQYSSPGRQTPRAEIRTVLNSFFGAVRKVKQPSVKTRTRLQQKNKTQSAAGGVFPGNSESSGGAKLSVNLDLSRL
jgi:hypothetical protein